MSDMDSDLCPICQESDDCYMTSCDHHFCNPCLKKWLTKRDTCPTCRTIIRHEYIDEFGLNQKNYANIAVLGLIDVAKYLHQEVQKYEYHDSKKDVLINIGKILYNRYNE